MWEGVRDRTELQHIDPHSYGHQRFFSVLQGCSTGGPGPSTLLGAGFLYHILSPNSSDLQKTIGGPTAPSAGCWLSLPHLVSNWLNFLCTQLYNSSPPTQFLPITGHRNMHFRRLWNGIFDRHRAEITVMQFTGHSLPVHQFVTVPWDFNPVPYCQPSSHSPMEYALPPSLEWHVWRGRRSIYNNCAWKLKFDPTYKCYIHKPESVLENESHWFSGIF